MNKKHVTYTRVMLTVLVLLVSYMLFWPVDVIKDGSWNIKVQGDVHYQNDILNVSSTYTKLREVIGTSRRYLDCKNEQGVFVRYEINAAEANRKAGSRGTGIKMGIPQEIPTPTECRVAISIRYEVYPLRSHTEYNESDLFKLLPESDRPQDAPVDSQPVVSQSTPSSSISAPSQPAPAPAPTTNTTIVNNQPAANPAPVVPVENCRFEVLFICVRRSE